MATIVRTWGNANAKYVASNASTSASILDRLSKHGNVQVRIAVGDNENTSRNTSMQLAQDDNPDLRYAMAENHHIHKDVLDFLAKDLNPFVANRAQKTILRLKQAVPLLAEALKKVVCKKPKEDKA